VNKILVAKEEKVEKVRWILIAVKVSKAARDAKGNRARVANNRARAVRANPANRAARRILARKRTGTRINSSRFSLG
jgi:hypothetical protein